MPTQEQGIIRNDQGEITVILLPAGPIRTQIEGALEMHDIILHDDEELGQLTSRVQPSEGMRHI